MKILVDHQECGFIDFEGELLFQWTDPSITCKIRDVVIILSFCLKKIVDRLPFF